MNDHNLAASLASHAHGAAERLKTERLLLFTDAVFAIIVTLLALEVRPPDGAELDTTQAVLHTLDSMSTKFGAYALSFAVIALVWNAHLVRYRHVVAVNGKVIAGNMLQLMLVGLVPFATTLIARHVNPMVVSLYAAIILTNVLIGWGTWLIAVRDPKSVGPEFTSAMLLQGNVRSAAVAVIFASSIGIAWWSPVIAMFTWALQIPVNRVINRFCVRETRPA